jgi:hypothetical protein
MRSLPARARGVSSLGFNLEDSLIELIDSVSIMYVSMKVIGPESDCRPCFDDDLRRLLGRHGRHRADSRARDEHCAALTSESVSP